MKKNIAHGKIPVRALTIRQPFAEQILQGTRRLDYRQRPTLIRERVFIYAPNASSLPVFEGVSLERSVNLAKGVLVGTVEVTGCVELPNGYAWKLDNPQRLAEAIKPQNKPQSTWFQPF